MTRAENNKKGNFNALDVTIVLLVVLTVLGIAGRIFLDRHNSKGLEERQISFTCVMPESKVHELDEGAKLYTASGNKLGNVVSVEECVTENDSEVGMGYVLITGILNVSGYEQKNGVFCSADGEELRINTELSLKNGKNVHFYINDIVKNGQ